jgi:hypothetical protein
MSLFPARRNDLQVMEWCRASGAWQFNCKDGDWWYITNNDARRNHRIGVRHSAKLAVVKFSAKFPMRFSLRPEPPGLFARLLMRSHDLAYASWIMNIADSCEAQPYLFAQWPATAMTPVVFNAICNEMRDEIDAFGYELRSKFQYGGGEPPPHGTSGVPAIRPDSRGIQWEGGAK